MASKIRKKWNKIDKSKSNSVKNVDLKMFWLTTRLYRTRELEDLPEDFTRLHQKKAKRNMTKQLNILEGKWKCLIYLVEFPRKVEKQCLKRDLLMFFQNWRKTRVLRVKIKSKDPKGWININYYKVTNGVRIPVTEDKGRGTSYHD